MADTLRAATAVASAWSTLARSAVVAATRRPRSALRDVPFPTGGRPVLPPGWPGAATRHTVAAGAATAEWLGRLADALVPRVVEGVLSRIDVTVLVEQFVDLDRIAARLDVDAVAARIDIDAVVARVDVDTIAAGLDLDTLVEKVDIARVIDRVDLDAVVDRVDPDRIAARVDLDRVVARVDLDRIVDRLDIDRAAARIDIDSIIERADIVGLARYVLQEIDIAGIVRSSTDAVTTEMVRDVRAHSVDADRAVERVVDRLLRRPGRRTALAPGDGHDRR